MIKEWVNSLKNKKQKLIEVSSSNACKENNEENIEIIVDTYKNFFRMYLSDYVSITKYAEITKEKDPSSISKNISMNVLWNNGKQKVNKGTFYVLLTNNVIYNFLINGNKIKIDERIKLDEESHEKIFSFDFASDEYRLVFFKHDRIGSTFYNMYYPPEEYMEKFGLTREETYSEVKGLLERVLGIENVLDLMDVNFIKKKVLNDLKPDVVKKEYKDNETFLV